MGVGFRRQLLDQPLDVAVAQLAGIQPLAQLQRQQLDGVAEGVALAQVAEGAEQLAEVFLQRRRIEQSGVRKGTRVGRQIVAHGFPAVARQAICSVARSHRPRKADPP